MYSTTVEENSEAVALANELLGAAGLRAPAAGQITVTGRDPVFPMKYKLGTAGTAALAAVGTAVSHLWELRGGEPQHVSIDASAAAVALRAVYYFHINGERPAEHRDPLAGFYRVRDGRWIYLHVYFPVHRDAALKVLGASDGADAQRQALDWDGLELETAIHAAGGCASFVRTRDEWRRHPQYAALQKEPLFEVIRIGDAPPVPLRAASRPLENLRVLDLTRVLAGPVSTRTLAEHGASVLRITAPHLPDLGPLEYDYGVGKRSAHLDLRDREGCQKLTELIRQTDVFCQSYRPGALDKLGFGIQDLAAQKPGLIYATIDAWGYTGPWAGRRGYDSIVQGANGMVHEASTPGQRPQLVRAMPMDYLAGYLMAFGIIAALAKRAQEGGTWAVRVSLARAGEWLLNLGFVPDSEYAILPSDLDPKEIAALSIERESGIGAIRQIKPVLGLSHTPPRLELPPVRLGSHPAEWTH